MSNTASQLLVVVDTEEEFDWRGPFSRESTDTRSIPSQDPAHEIFDRFGIVPTYVVDYPVATDPDAIAYLRGLKVAGKARIGAHLHPWVTPPHEEDITARNSYQCNLPPALEARKIDVLTRTIERNFGERPTVFKAGRYGFGRNTRQALVDLGYKVDCSVVPFVSLAADGGPSFYRMSPRPYWLDVRRKLLEVPNTSGYFGRAAWLGRHIQPLFDNPIAAGLHLPGILARTNIVARSRLSPEGVTADEQCRLLESLHARGQRLFSLTYHSPSLAPGNTPYVRNEADLAEFLRRIETVLTFFRDRLGGSFTTLDDVYLRERAAIGHKRRERRAAAHV